MDDRNAVTHVEETVQNGDKVVLPAIYLDASKDDLAELIADMLERVIAINDRIPLVPAALTRFHSRTPPTISVLDYIRRIVAYASPDRTVMLAPLHYLSTIANRLPLFALSSLTVHRFLISAIAAASKGLCDTFCTNSLYARVGGITVQELNTLEREFLAAVDWQLVVSTIGVYLVAIEDDVSLYSAAMKYCKNTTSI